MLQIGLKSEDKGKAAIYFSILGAYLIYEYDSTPFWHIIQTSIIHIVYLFFSFLGFRGRC